MFPHVADKLRTFEMFIDISFALDIILTFLTLPPATSIDSETTNEPVNVE